METEVAEGFLQVDAGATTGLAAADPMLAKLVDQLQVTKEALNVPAAVTDDDTRPRFGKIAMLFRRTMYISLFLVFLLALGGIAPSLLFGRVTDIIQDSNGADTSAAYFWAIVARVHRRRRRLRVEVLPDLRAAVQPERDRRAPPSRASTA